MKTDTINPDLKNTALVGSFNQEELILFDFFKKAILEIFPLIQDIDEQGKPVGKLHFAGDNFENENTIELSENFAFNAVSGLSDYIDRKTHKKVYEVLRSYNLLP